MIPPSSAVGETEAVSHEAKSDADVERHGSDLRQQSLWTASDARGPLEKAEDDQTLSVDDEPATITDRPPSAMASESYASQDAGRRSSWPIAAGIVCGALIGAGGALLAEYQGLLGGPNAASEAQVAALSSRIDTLEQKPTAASDAQGLSQRLAALAAKVDALAKQPADAQAPAPNNADVGALKQSVAALQTSVDALKSKSDQPVPPDHGTDEKVAALSSELAGLKTTASQNEASLASVKDDQKRLSDKVAAPAFAAAADSLARQVDQGEPYGPQLDALTSLGADPAKLAILRQNAGQGVPSAKVLAQKFEAIAEPISATSQKVPANAGFVDRLKSGMFNMVSVRSVDDTSGTDLPSRVARIKLDLAHDDIADAVSTWDALPADARAKGEAWGALARASAQAKAAAVGLQNDSIVALGAKKS